MRWNYVPDRAVLGGAAATALWLGGVLLVHAAGAPSPVAALTTVDRVSNWLLVGGVPGGLVTGALAHEYAPAMKQGLSAAAAGALAVAVAVGCFGTGLSILRGYGADSVLSFLFTGPTMFAFLVLVPILSIEGVIAAVVASEAKLRLRRRGTV